MNFQNNFFRTTFLVLVMVAISTIILTVSRSVFLAQQVDISMLSGREPDLFRALFVGLRFDLKVITIAFAPLYLIGIFFSAFPGIFRALNKAIPYYAALIFFLLTAFSIGNYYYYVTFGNYFDVFVFGLVDDDTEAVLVNAWQDYPIVISFLVTLLVTSVSVMALRKVVTRGKVVQFKSIHWSVMSVIVFLAILAYATLARGGLSTLPLKRYHANVSDYDVLNKATPNAFMALDWARGDYKDQAKFEPVTLEALTAQMNKVLGQPTPEYKTARNAYLEQNKPHVVMTLMEGFGTNVLIEDNPESNDLLGALRKPFEEDFLFKRFVSGSTATIDSMVMMLFHSANPTISHSSIQRVPLPSSAVLPYKKAGYEVVYITPGNAMWRNLANYLPVQGFDRIVDENTLLREFPEASEFADTWGVPDEFAFKYAERLLKNSNKPLMIYILTVTNHSPFKAPDSYIAKPTKVSERMNELLGPLQEHGKALLGAYQYANDTFGQFIQNIKNSSLADKTLIAGTGDHRMRYLSADRINEFAISVGVPFYLYVPQDIQEKVQFKYDSNRIGSHKDVFPTLYAFSLSDVGYISLGGENLLSPGEIDNFGFQLLRNITIEGGYSVYQPDKLYPWADDGLHNEVEPVENMNPEQGKEFRILLDYYLRWQVAK
ncbi:LTA synthase family protein [Vibrio sp. SCSIO 43137]|uniref:LTA synthase family protein n=1 Tax=Vibrio sp. SCSIO 43137 TaxID=3021011 RepID=UPI002308118B|nr:alkaline phosphatase family protein [Vibrio sp. SCSIO 43137]WCE29837.1 sulfatase-like hydrolase/transferase [Vibrio sp. SCSIO 43137]